MGQPPNALEYSTPERERTALHEWLERYWDQDFSLTDGVSFTVMAELDIREALSLDRHFATAGFTVLPEA